MSKHLILAGLLVAGMLPGSALAQAKHSGEWKVRQEWVRAHESFLASPVLQGRGSATRDEAIAAAYVAAQFESFGLQHAPGMESYLQTAKIIKLRADGALLTAGGAAVADPQLLMGSARPVAGKLVVFDGKDPAAMPAGEVVLATGDASVMQLYRAASAKKAKLLIVRAGEESAKLLGAFGGKPRMPTWLDGTPVPERLSIVALPAASFDALAGKAGADVSLTLLGLVQDVATTTNAIGWLPGRDPKAGVILYTAHLDHLGLRPDGVMMPGANDDASGTTAVLELARALAAGKKMRRGILFVAYGSEEIGGFGSTWFGMHPPVPLSDIAANIEFEMIGAQDPKFKNGDLMMTGYERSNLGEALRAHGALLMADPYPEQNFFRRSDNYSLALKGVVAHTISGWAVTPTYHSPEDSFANLDIPFMTRAIQSLIGPARWLADSDFTPEWKPGGRPEE